MIARGSTRVSAGAILFVVAAGLSCGGDGTAPPKATALIFVTEPSATAETMVPLPTQPVVQTVDANGNAAGTSTTISVANIGTTGTVVANGTAATTGTGRATFSNLTLGAIHGTVGTVTLQFGAAGLQPITATIELRCAVHPLSIGQTVNRTLTEGDCTFGNGAYHNMFALNTTQAVTAVKLGFSGSFQGSLQTQGPNESSYFWGYTANGTTPNNSFSYNALMPAGRNLIGVAAPSQLGTYSLTTSSVPEDLKCENTTTSVASPITTAQQLADGDCIENSFFEDGVVFGLPPNATVNTTMSSSAFDPQIKVLNGLTQALVASSTAPASTSVTYTNTGVATPFVLVLTSSVSQMSGPYNLSLNIQYPATAAGRASLTLPQFEPKASPRTPPWRGKRLAPN